MPQIIIATEGPGAGEVREVHRERIAPVDVETERAGHLLVERIGWALHDAERIERMRDDEDPTAAFRGDAGTIADATVI